MSLQIWLPLNGNLNNYGCCPMNSATQTTAPTYVNGKIGKAMSTGAFYIPASYAKTFYNNEAMSFAFWICPIGTSGSGTILGQSAMAVGDNRMFTIYQYDTPLKLHLSWQSNESSGTFFAMGATDYFTENVWSHIAITYNGSSVKVYKDGVLKNSMSCTKSTRTNFEYNVPVSNSSIRYLNDLRIYDHCLSDKEIKEISKGLIVHFPLNDQYNLGAINKYSGDNAEGMMNSSSWTKTKLSNERGWNYKYTYTGDGNNKWLSCEMPHYSFTAGKRYYYSIKVRCNKWTNGSLSFRAARSSNDYGDGGVSVTICSTSLADGKWHEYSISQIVNSTYTRSGTSVTCNPVLEFYTSNFNGNGTVYDMDFDLKDAQVVESDNYVPFIQNEYISSSVLDISGYRNNGTKSGTISVVNDTPKYNISTYFPSGTGIFAHPAITLTSFTISFWAKHTATGKMVFGSNASISSTNSSWYWYGDKSFKFPLGEFYYSYNAGTEAALLNTWVHFVAVYNGSNVTVYRNGVNEGNKAFTGSVLLDYLSIGHGYTNTSYLENSYMSDFRLYCTALSANDVLELYNKPISIDNSGKVYALEYNEV